MPSSCDDKKGRWSESEEKEEEKEEEGEELEYGAALVVFLASKQAAGDRCFKILVDFPTQSRRGDLDEQRAIAEAADLKGLEQKLLAFVLCCDEEANLGFAWARSIFAEIRQRFFALLFIIYFIIIF